MSSRALLSALALLPALSWAGEYRLTVDEVTIDTGDFRKQGAQYKVKHRSPAPAPRLFLHAGDGAIDSV